MTNQIQFENFVGRGTIKKNGLFSRPTAISCFCPHCSSKVSITLSDITASPTHELWPTTGKCPDCQKKIRVVFFYSDVNEARNPISAAMHPTPGQHFDPIRLPEGLPEKIQRAIRDTEATFSAKLYSPSLTSGRRALEGMFKHLAADHAANKKLYDLIEFVCGSDTATSSLKSLAHAIRHQGNLGAHFDLEKEADFETAKAVIELLNYLISYFFLLPEKIKQLEKDT